jgi:hypothetical protein
VFNRLELAVDGGKLMDQAQLRTGFTKQEVCELLTRIVCGSVPREHKLYSSRLVCWLMVGQFLFGVSTLLGAVNQCFEEGCRQFMGECRRKRLNKLSRNTSALAQARQRVALPYFEGVLAALHETVRGHAELWHGRLAYLIDGTSLTGQASAKLRNAYPPITNQYGESVFPVALVTVAHNLTTGVAEQPEYGPMYGNDRDGELKQTVRLFARLDPGSVVVSDRAHGIFFMALSAQQHGLDVVYRLTDSRAKAMLKNKQLHTNLERTFAWAPSGADRRKHPELSPDKVVDGRIIVRHIRHGKQRIKLILFTTLPDSITADEIVALYARRWEIEGEIRDIKKTLALDRINAKTPAVFERQILAAVIAYNIVRVMMLLAARRHGIENPKRLSFANAADVMRMEIPNIMRARHEEELLRIVDRAMEAIAAQVNKLRPNRSFPRAAYPRRRQYALKKKSTSLAPL